jgi:tetraacyldisaccharide 4'-kinase
MIFNQVSAWYQPQLTWLTFLLLPLSWAFGVVISLRRLLFQLKVKKSHRFAVPVIVIGNITVGGTGKTPLVLWLAQLLKAHGFEPGIVSRGVGGIQQISPRVVDAHSSVRQIGDEGILLAEKSGCQVVVGIDRVACVNQLLTESKCNVVISDDGLQHYALQRDIEIAVIDGARGLGNERLLPAGPLREKPSRLDRVDYIVRQGDALRGEFGMQLIAEKLISLAGIDAKKFSDFSGQRVHAVAAIGNPRRFFALLKKYNITVIEHIFPDHYFFQKQDLEFFDDLPVIMTEKDAVKCREFANKQYWYVPVVAKVDGGLEKAVLNKLTQYSRGEMQ